MKSLLLLGWFGVAFSRLSGQESVSLDGQWSLVPLGKPNEAVEVRVPGAWEDALGIGFDGVAIYRRNLPLTLNHRGARLSVFFRAVATHATVLCNGEKIAEHLGGWTPFRAELPGELRFDGTDQLEVRVDERVGHNTQGFLPIIQPHFGGIWQSVALEVDRKPKLDREGLFLFGRADGSIRAEVPVRPGPTPTSGLQVLIHAFPLSSTPSPGHRVTLEVKDNLASGEAVFVGGSPWSPASPRLLPLAVSLLAPTGEVLDTVYRQIPLRTFEARGKALFLNGRALQVRGILHWGYSPPHLAPPSEREFWKRQLQDFKSLGFNLVKCCLWIPPPVFYELCNELGLLVWQEYPTWHPKMDEAHRVELRREYEEFFRFDRRFGCVAIRSLTCETGSGAELSVLKELYDACHAAVPDTLVVDDSSWIGWQRVTDFWDEHPYGNNSWWPGRLRDFQKHIAEKGEKPLLLGECMAADTWFDCAEWTRTHGDAQSWWRPLCFEDQGRFEAWFARRIGEWPLTRLSAWSRRFGLENRKFQIERLRATIPEAGYVVSVARDFAKARMGLYDDWDRLKWKEEDFAWHRDTMFSLLTEQDARSFVTVAELPIVLSGGPDSKSVGVRCRLVSGPSAFEQKLALGAPRGMVTDPLAVQFEIAPTSVPRAWRFEVESIGQPQIRNAWTLWQVPAPHPADDRESRVFRRCDAELLDFVEAGGRGILLVGEEKPNFHNQKLWFLRGAPFVSSPSPLGLPEDFLLDLFAFDLETERMVAFERLGEVITTHLGFWETHDIAEVEAHWLLGSIRLGKGVLHLSTLRPAGPAGEYLVSLLRRAETSEFVPAGDRATSDALLSGLRAELAGAAIDLPTWKFKIDPKDEGQSSSWMARDFDDSAWASLVAGKHWEPQGIAHYDGIGWYRLRLTVPSEFRAQAARLIFEGIDDSATIWLNGEFLAKVGDPVTKTTVWLEKTVVELGQRLHIGKENQITVRVVDHQGAGGLWRPVSLTTLPALRLLER